MDNEESSGISDKIWLQCYESSITEAQERLRFQVEFAQSMLKGLMIANGASIISLLTFIGNDQKIYDGRSIWWSFFWFCFGITFCLFAYFGAFFSQQRFMNASYMQAWNLQHERQGEEAAHEIKSDLRIGNCMFIIGLAFAGLSLVGFIFGAFVALGGIL